MLRRLRWVAPLALAAVALTACSSGASSTQATTSDVSTKADQLLAQLDTEVLAKGPHGEAPSPGSAVDLTDSEVAQVKALKATAAIAMHYGGNDWATAQIAGLKARFAELGIDIVATTDANFDASQQVSDIETIMAKKPNILVSIPTDTTATAAAYKAAEQAGIKLVFMDNVPDGLTAGTDYVTCVSADNYGNGVVSALLLAKALGGKGKIATIFHNADFFVTAQRYQGFKDTLAKDFPDIQIVEEQGIGGPDFAGDAQKVTDALVTKHADLNAIWGVWDVPAEGIMASLRASGRTDIKIATEDLGTNVAIALAQNDMVVGLGAQRPYDQGVAEANAAAGALIGKTAPVYVALGALPVTHENVLDAWKTVYHADPPAEVTSSYKK